MPHLSDRQCITRCAQCERAIKERKKKVMPLYKYFVFAHPEDKGKHYNSIPTVLYDAAVDADGEAKRLAAKEPHVRFCVGVLYKHYVNVPYPEINEVDYAKLPQFR